MLETDALDAYNKLREQLTSDGVPVKATKTFGMATISLNGKVVGGYYPNGMVVKLAPGSADEALSIPGTELFDPMGGRPMKNWVVIPVEHKNRWREFVDKAIESLGERTKKASPLRSRRQLIDR